MSPSSAPSPGSLPTHSPTYVAYAPAGNSNTSHITSPSLHAAGARIGSGAMKDQFVIGYVYACSHNRRLVTSPRSARKYTITCEPPDAARRDVNPTMTTSPCRIDLLS